MNNETAAPPVSIDQLPQYGSGGDPVGVRRIRRSFRFLVAAAILLTVALWFMENFYRYSRHEGIYRSALTLDEQSARPVLRQVVKEERESENPPSARYLAALAVREEEDLDLGLFQEASALDPANGFLLIQYGNALFKHADYAAARERYREAGLQPPRNALPNYLEAAALAANLPADSDWGEVMSLVGRGNTATDPILFPEPLWHASLSTRGNWYQRLRETHIRECLKPLFALRGKMLDRARTALQAGEPGEWEVWIPRIEQMGRRFIGTHETPPEQLGYLPAIFGVQLTGDALVLRQALDVQLGRPENTARENELKVLEEAQGELTAYDEKRLATIERHGSAVTWPRSAIVLGLFLLGAVYGLSIFWVWLLGARSGAGTRPHPAYIRIGLFGATLLWTLLLLGYDGLLAPSISAESLPPLLYGWLALLAAALVAGIAYATFTLPAPGPVLERNEVPINPATLREARRLRRQAAAVLFRRYCGALVGGFLCSICGYAVLFRLFFGQYPLYKVNMLIMDTRLAELEAVRSIIEKLY